MAPVGHDTRHRPGHRWSTSWSAEVRRVLQIAALGEQLDAALGGAELVVAVARQLDAALEERERLVERQVAVFELLDDLLELGNGRLEVFDGISHGFVLRRARPGRPARLRPA